VADFSEAGSGAGRSLIPRSHFTRIADAHEVDAKTVERDYVLTHVVAAISRRPDRGRMAFNGGTALRLCYFRDYRYSADLDFSLVDGMTV
jgi:predicted nucleotidyltransferase component of viral defense system